MPALRNARQERFAQALALGLAPREAYERAGYTPGVRAAAAAARLQSSTGLKARLAELAARSTGTGKPRAGAQRDAGFAGVAKAIASGEVALTSSTSQHEATRSQPAATSWGAGCGVTASAETASDKATSNGSRSNGSEKPISNGVAPDTSPSDTTARDDTAPETSPPAIATPPEPAPVGATIDSLIAEFEEARQLALEVKQPAAAVSATMSKARIFGLIGEKGDARPGDRPSEVSDLEVARRIAFLLARCFHAMPDGATH
jgi:hypothetical protein